MAGADALQLPVSWCPSATRGGGLFFSAWGLPVNWLHRERLTPSPRDERHQHHGSILVLNVSSQQDQQVLRFTLVPVRLLWSLLLPLPVDRGFAMYSARSSSKSSADLGVNKVLV